MYGRKNRELRQAELEEARLGFIQFLRRKRFSPQFIASHGDELFATAALEYSRKIAAGTEIESPAGWLITCAWQRTKSLLESQSRSPQVVSTDKAEAIRDELGQSPEDVALDEDRFRKVQAAVEELPEEERQLLTLAYFEDMAVREVARELDWHPSKAQRCHEAARAHLQKLLGVESLDELELDVGLAAYVSLVGAGSSSLHLPAGVEAIAERVSRGAASGWARAQDLARRVPLGGGTESPAGAALGSGAGRAAGICGAAALACLASGVVGPGVGGVNLLGGDGQGAPATKSRRVADAPRVGPLTPRGNPAPASTAEATHPKTASADQQRSANSPASAKEQRARRATQAVRSQSLESAAGGPEEASAPVESAPVAETSAPPPSEPSSSGSTPTQVANEQFGP